MKRLRDIAIYAIAVLVGCGLALSIIFGFDALVDKVSAQTVAAPPADLGQLRGAGYDWYGHHRQVYRP